MCFFLFGWGTTAASRDLCSILWPLATPLSLASTFRHSHGIPSESMQMTSLFHPFCRLNVSHQDSGPVSARPLTLHSCIAASQHRLQPHLQLLQELRGAPSLQDHLQTPGLPGHCRGHGGAAEDCQELGKRGPRRGLGQPQWA